MENDNAGWIPYDQEFPSGHMKPTRFVGCRCNCVYRLFDPRDQGEDLTIENARPSDEIQSLIPDDGSWDDGIKPDNYDDHTTSVLPARYFNAIGEKATYIQPKGRAYYQAVGNKINLGDTRSSPSKYVAQMVEAHEVGHFFFTRVVLPNEAKYIEFKKIFKASVDEVKELIKDKELRAILNPHNGTSTVAKGLMTKYKDLESNTSYTITKKIIQL